MNWYFEIFTVINNFLIQNQSIIYDKIKCKINEENVFKTCF